MISIYAQSTQYITVSVTNSQGVNPTSDIVQFAFLGPMSNVSQANEQVPTASTTFYTGLWPSTSPVSNTSNTYDAAILIGPQGGAASLSTGTYLCIVKITDSPEVPWLFSGPIAVS
jgi:hypothetical protein